MSILKKLRRQTRPLGVKEIAELFDVAKPRSTLGSRGEVPAIRIATQSDLTPAFWLIGSNSVRLRV